VCAGPGGFSEYVLWRRCWKAKGFGFTLKNENDFRLQDFYAGPCESFEPHYGQYKTLKSLSSLCSAVYLELDFLSGIYVYCSYVSLVYVDISLLCAAGKK
jgi:hypothetical protein